MKPLGLILIAIGCAAPLIWLPSLAQGRDVIALFSQYLGMLALITMAFAQVIATRWPGIEAVFGPMDQAYRVHKWLGIAGLATILLHDTIDADMQGLGPETALVDIAETMGELSLYGILILVVITIATFIPYHLWKWTHRLIGIFFVLGAFHYVFILKPFSNGDPLGIYMGLVCLIGTLAYLYTSAPRGLRPAKAYRITGTSREGDALAVEMTPQGRACRHRAGQFAFFAFTGAGMNEPHPFTISNAPRDDGGLRITVAPLGDLTSRVVNALQEGQDVRVQGPFGRFGRTAKGPQVWIAAGVGITPFVALAESLPASAEPVRLIYAVRLREQAAHLALLEELARQKSNLDLTVWESATSGRLTADKVSEIAGPDLGSSNVLFCGPGAMREALGKSLTRFGISQRQYHYEEFEIRTGIGLESLLHWLWARRKRYAAPR